MAEREIKTRKPTVTEAIDWIMMNSQEWARRYRRECLKYWREQYGDLFADQVEAGVKARWGKR